MRYKQKHKYTYDISQEEAAAIEQAAVADQAKARETTVSTHSDELLDEIDGLLEENAQDFIKNFQQQGGE